MKGDPSIVCANPAPAFHPQAEFFLPSVAGNTNTNPNPEENKRDGSPRKASVFTSVFSPGSGKESDWKASDFVVTLCAMSTSKNEVISSCEIKPGSLGVHVSPTAPKSAPPDSAAMKVLELSFESKNVLNVPSGKKEEVVESLEVKIEQKGVGVGRVGKGKYDDGENSDGPTRDVPLSYR